MPLLEETILTDATESPAIIAGLPVTVLDAIAARLRGTGCFFALLDKSGVPIYHDRAASPLFSRYLLPQLQSHQAMVQPFRDAIAELTATSSPRACDAFPGLSAVLLPHLDKRHLAGVLMLVGKSEAFTMGEETLREANRFGLDATWLAKQADAVSENSPASIAATAKLLPAMLRDQARLGASEQEIQSLSTQLANSYEELSLIYQVSAGMKINRGTGEFFRETCLDCREVVNLRGMGFALIEDGNAHPAPALIGESDLPAHLVPKLANQLIAVLCDRKKPLMVSDLSQDHRFGWLAGFAKQLLAVPLMRQEKVLGCLFGLDKLRGEFDSVDMKLLGSIANESAIYLENAILFDDVRNLMMGVLHSLTSAVDAKDAYTCGHSERVALLSKCLATELKLPESLIERIYMAGILHDVGKIGVPEAVLHKAGKLTAEEFEQMKKHPQIGARILADIKQIQDLIPGVLYHHERFDGRGYPARLSGAEIPQMGRIICIADCFDAMTSNRTYRRALPLEVAMIEVRRCAGTQFDPEMAEAFLRIKPDALRKLLQEHQARAIRAAA